MKLIREMVDIVDSSIIESTSGKKDMYISGIFMQTEAKNKNGRIYPREMMQRKLDEYKREFIDTKRAMGELEHPPTPQINLDRVSHIITELNFEDNDIYGKAKLLDTPCGKIARGIIEGGVQLGVSSRGLGSVKNRGGVNEVQDDFQLVTVDIVGNPSAHKALVQGIMEGAEWVWESGAWQERHLDEGRKELEHKYNEERALRLFQQLMISIRN